MAILASAYTVCLCKKYGRFILARIFKICVHVQITIMFRLRSCSMINSFTVPPVPSGLASVTSSAYPRSPPTGIPGDPGDSYAYRFQKPDIYMAVASPSTSSVARSLPYIAVAYPLKKLFYPDILRANAFHGGYNALQYMVDAVEFPDPFHGDDIFRVLHDAYDAMVALCAVAYAAGIGFSNIAAYGTVARLQLCFLYRIGQRFRFSAGRFNMWKASL